MEWAVPLGNHDENFNHYEIFDDQERYLKMAVKLEPNDPLYLLRNENTKLDLNFSTLYKHTSIIYANHLFHSQ